MRTCTECNANKPASEFLPIRGTPDVYGRCRECRNTRARERYHSTPEVRIAEIARSWRNKQRRRAERTPL
jgi:hypothetical protein